MAWNLPAAIVNAVDRTAAWFNAISDCFDALDKHTHANTDGDGATLTELYVNRDEFFIAGTAYDSSGGSISRTAGTDDMFDSFAGGSAQNDYMEYTPFLRAGTYTLRLLYVEGLSRGIITLSINGVAHATTVDTFAGSATADRIATFTDIVFTADQAQAIRLTTLTKNASSAGYTIQFQGMHLQRTGD